MFAMQTPSALTAEELVKRDRMLFWEGIFLLSTILVGGFVQILFIRKEQKLNHKLKLFFSSFSHDIKTSISRLRLQSDILREDSNYQNNKTLQRLAKDISKLDLQLENSMNLTSLDQFTFLLEPTSIQQTVQTMASDFLELKVEVSQEAHVRVDQKVLISVFRNIFENALRHGKAKTVWMKVIQSSDNIRIEITNDGEKVPVDAHLLGKELLRDSNSKGSGIGLFISKALVEKMQGKMLFEQELGKLKQILVLKKV